MRIGTRGSALALWQARTVAKQIEGTGGRHCEIVIIRTSGDEAHGPPDAPDTNVKRMFVKEIEEALLDGRIDLAVHSAKDLPAILPDGLRIAATLERDDPRDVLVLSGVDGQHDFDAMRTRLGAAPRIGSSSVRRAAQLRAVFRAASFVPIRGNVDTRLKKLDEGACDALVLAAAGLHRLQLHARIAAYLPVEVSVPAPGQGIIAVEISADASTAIKNAVLQISDADVLAALTGERAVVHALGGGCQMPLGALATVDGPEVAMIACVASLDGRTIIRASARGHRGNPAAIGEKLAAILIERGASRVLGDAATGER